MMTSPDRRPLMALAVALGFTWAAAARDSAATVLLLVPAAFSSALMLWALRPIPSSVNPMMARHVEVTP